LKNPILRRRIKMKSLFPKCLPVLALWCCLLLTSCGGGGGSLTAGGGIDGTGIMSAGVVSAFGSIFVNGTEFDTSNAAIIINGEEIGVGDEVVRKNLDIGMVVTVEGTINADGISGIADRVTYTNNVAGPVESISSIDATTKEIVVLGQTVIINVITKFKPDSYGFDGIAPDDVVEVSGYFDDNGAIRATFIEKTGDITTILEYEITGLVEDLNITLKTFMINSLVVDYSSIAKNLTEGIPADGLFVEVEGRLAAGGELLATSIELADELGGEDGDEVEIMGFVTQVLENAELIKFLLGNQEVYVDPETALFVDGFPDDIAPGVKLEAEGSLEGGILFAREIEFWEPDQIEVEGFVTQVVSQSEFTVGEQDVQTDGETVFEPPDLEIAVDLKIEVKGVPVDIEQSVIEADKVSLEVD
jgi:hypothetical protein